ncbi:class I SAM-dependent methyltransferase [Treponema primitia]|uniref:class I SAM-dependent methyltransferase n=1 Tax=Treponema primitia TaxID=88058 RepID=UPI00031876E9|nr:class I SAM-dependent methyltransferase [Treponema primitia]
MKSPESPGSLLVVPLIEKNRGGGHLVRSAALVRALRTAGREAFLFLPEVSGEHPPDDIFRIAGLFVENTCEPWVLQEDPRKPRRSGADRANTGFPDFPPWDFIILDQFQTLPEEAASWAALAPLIGIDEGGPARSDFDFLIDLLPNFNRLTPNVSAPSLLPLPKNRRPSFFRDASFEGSPVPPAGGPSLRVLISFGAEDPGELGFPAAMSLARRALPEQFKITLVAPGLPEDKAAILEAAFVRVTRGAPELREQLADYDLLITHFGLTAFEAIHARLPVILVSPGPYHEKLARNAGFFSAGIGPGAASRIGRLFFPYKKGLSGDFLHSLSARCRNIAKRYGLEEPTGELGSILAEYSPQGSRSCPVCGDPQRGSVTLARFPGRSYRRCSHCGMVYLFASTPSPVEYETDYFFSFYKEQYGKTYLEDFPNLVLAGQKRLCIIKALLRGSSGKISRNADRTGENPRLLDIGCAYGPFLAAARDQGFSPQGMDPAEGAVRYVREELGISAQRGMFPDLSRDSLAAGSFTVVSLWYVIEHFMNLNPVLREINRLLRVGGILAFSTPSFRGISGRKSICNFLEKSPRDHWTVWEPGICKKVLARYGFALKKIVITGHHPERFFKGLKKGGLSWNFVFFLSRLFGLGDTFECYAIKKRDL